MFVLSSCLILASCSDQINDPDIVISSKAETYFNVNFPSSRNGYVIIGNSKATKDKDYSFSITILKGYDSTDLVVKNNGVELASSSLVYTIKNVDSDINITVDGIIQSPLLSIKSSSYKFYLGHIEDSFKEKSYFLDGASGSYNGNKCNVDVDISKVDFDSIGEYEIKYSLVGHADICKKAKVVILDNPSKINDVSIDISSVYDKEIVSKSTFGEANLDFALYNEDHLLSDDEVFVNGNYDGNYLSKDYLKSLGLGEFRFKIVFDENVSQEFNVSIVDEKGPNYEFSSSNKDVCFTKGNLVLPDFSLGQDSIQEIEANYFIDNEEKTKEEIKEDIDNKEGDYSYAISIIYKGNTVEKKEYSIHIRDSYIPFSFASSGSKYGRSYYSSTGNPVLSFDYKDGDTDVMLDEQYISSNNIENKKYVFIAFRILTNSTQGASLWNRDPSVCFDESGNYVPTDSNPKYNGDTIANPGALMYKTFALNGNKFENDVWIMRGFVGSIEILKIEFCDLDYKDPIVDIEATRSKLANLNSSFDTIWNYIHVGLVGSSGGASMGGNCIDIQPSLFTDLSKCSLSGIKLKIKVNDRSDIKKMECWIRNEKHISSSDGAVDDEGFINIDIPLTLLENRIDETNNFLFYFNISSSDSASNYEEISSKSNKNYVDSLDFVISSVELY